MLGFALFAVLFTLFLFWVLTGVDPLLQGIRALIIVRAGIGLALLQAHRAARTWWRLLPRAVSEVKKEVAA
jgi:hypothetical protein